MRRCDAALVCGLLVSLWSHLAWAAASSHAFILDSLPKGKSVTIPHPATTLLSVNMRAQFKATDMPQSLSFTVVHTDGGRVVPIRLAIYDKHADRVNYATVKPGTPFIYPFHAIDPITVIAEMRDPSSIEIYKIKVRVESNKPLEIAH